MKFVFTSTLFFLLTVVTNVYADEEGYSAIPSSDERAQPTSIYTVIEDFPNLEIVKEGTGGEADPQLVRFITDPELKYQIQTGHFTSLQLKHLAVIRTAVFTENNRLHIPFVVTVKHTQGKQTWYNVNQGAIEVSGEIQVLFDGGNFNVQVLKFYDSQKLEHVGRWLGANSEINLDFARKITKPVLEGYFNLKPARITALINSAYRGAKPALN